MRCFLAVPVEGSVVREVLRLQNLAESSGCLIKPVKPENLHVTLKFFGEIKDEDVKEIMKLCSTIRLEEFEILFRGVGFFPSEKAPRVLWIGVEGLEPLLEAVTNALRSKFGSAADKPHLTVCRFRKYVPFRPSVPEIRHTVKKFSLYSSTLTPGGPIYREIGSFELSRKPSRNIHGEVREG